MFVKSLLIRTFNILKNYLSVFIVRKIKKNIFNQAKSNSFIHSWNFYVNLHFSVICNFTSNFRQFFETCYQPSENETSHGNIFVYN